MWPTHCAKHTALYTHFKQMRHFWDTLWNKWDTKKQNETLCETFETVMRHYFYKMRHLRHFSKIEVWGRLRMCIILWDIWDTKWDSFETYETVETVFLENILFKIWKNERSNYCAGPKKYANFTRVCSILSRSCYILAQLC